MLRSATRGMWLLVALASVPHCTTSATQRPRLAASTAFSSEAFKEHLVLLYKGTYLAYGGGRGSERDLPECSSYSMEACNLSHRRYWLPPIVERLCRCPGHTACTLHGYNTQAAPDQRNDQLVQHISNRAHMQFCNVGSSSSGLQVCAGDRTGLTVQVVERQDGLAGARTGDTQAEDQQEGGDAAVAPGAIVLESHTTLQCLCPPPSRWQLRRTASQPVGRNSSLSRATHDYTCQQLTQCTSGDVCSAVRPDTYESYYTCSCPPRHLCLLPRGATRVGPAHHSLPHYGGPTLTGICTPLYTTIGWW